MISFVERISQQLRSREFILHFHLSLYMKKDSKLKLEWSKDIKVLTKSVPASREGGVEGGGGGGGGAVGTQVKSGGECVVTSAVPNVDR